MDFSQPSPLLAAPILLWGIARAATDAEVIQGFLDAGVNPTLLASMWGVMQGGWPVATAAIVGAVLWKGKTPELKGSITHVHQHRFDRVLKHQSVNDERQERERPAAPQEEDP